MIIVFSAIKAVKEVIADDRPHEAAVNQIIAEIVYIAAILILPGVIANRGFHRILMNVSDNGQKLRAVVDRAAEESGLEKISDTLVFFVIPIHKTGDDALEDPAHRHFACLDKQMDMIGHQTVGDEPKIANWLILPKYC